MRYRASRLLIVTYITDSESQQHPARVFVRRGISSNPGAATPQSLHALYKNQAAATANPYTLRQFTTPSVLKECLKKPLDFHGLLDGVTAPMPRRKSGSPPRASFKCVSYGPTHSSMRR